MKYLLILSAIISFSCNAATQPPSQQTQIEAAPMVARELTYAEMAKINHDKKVEQNRRKSIMHDKMSVLGLGK